MAVLEYGCIVYSGAASTHLNRLDQFQEKMCDFKFQSLTDCRNALILGCTCVTFWVVVFCNLFVLNLKTLLSISKVTWF